MTKLPDNAPLADRLKQLLASAERAHAHADLAVKELKTITMALSPRMLSNRRDAQEEDEGDATEFAFDSMSNLAGEAFNELMYALRALRDAIAEEDDEAEEDADKEG